ncbi:MAG: hypothetical protein ACRESX_04295 [Gammaproteobacteria bacterium]
MAAGWVLGLIMVIGAIPFAAADTTPGGSQNAGADDSSPTLTLNTSLSIDALDNRDYQFGGSVAVSDSTSYNFLYEYTNSPSGATNLLTHTYSVGVDQAISSATGFGLTYERWGKPGYINSDSLNGSLYWQNKTWKVTALPGLRYIALDARSGMVSGIPPAASITVSDYPLGLRVDFTGLQDWLFEVSTTRHDYNRDPDILSQFTSLPFFNGSIITRSQGFLSHSSTARIERDFDSISLAYDYEIDRSALDGTYSYTSDIDFTTPISDSFDMEIISGVTRSTQVSQNGFITLNFTYYH